MYKTSAIIVATTPPNRTKPKILSVFIVIFGKFTMPSEVLMLLWSPFAFALQIAGSTVIEPFDPMAAVAMIISSFELAWLFS